MTEQNRSGPTPASAWQTPIQEVELPSGNKAVLQKPSAITLLMESEDGVVPDALTQQLMDGLINGKAPEEGWTPTKDDLPKIGKLMRLICKAAFVSPKLVDGDADPGNNEISYDGHLSDDDRLFVFQWAWPEAEISAARKFPAKRRK